MIIIGYHLIGKKTLASKDNRYQVLKISEFTGDGWLSSYIGAASLFSDIGIDVFVEPTTEVVEELVRRGYGAVVIYPSLELKDEWEKRALDKFKNTGYLSDASLYNHINSNFEEDITFLNNFAVYSQNTYGYKIESLDYNLGYILDEIRGLSLMSNNTSKETFIWGVSRDGGTATAYTDNYISLTKDKKTGVYFLIVDGDIIEKGLVDDLYILIGMLKDWYRLSEYVWNEPEFELSLHDLYEDISITSGETIGEIIFKVEALINMIGDEE